MARWPGGPVARSAGGYRRYDADPAAVLERVKASRNPRPARHRELPGVLKGAAVPAHEEDFAWVVAALEAHTDR
ncbi:hypothetical protein [Streptomyces sp. NPDC014793]|uniref:hypothetical protein n=1 Tax=Streptomyces sp. NPDC014793 TaxID=3364914 RepID=UPI0037035BC1